MTPEQQTALDERLFPLSAAGLRALVDDDLKLVHYTTADTALKILEGKSLRFRSTTAQNDFSEIDHGQRCLSKAMASVVGGVFKSWLDGLFPNALGPTLSQRVIAAYDPMMDQMRFRSFILCLSEHRPYEDRYGRLSMWRAYGGKDGVALVFNTDVIKGQSDYLKVYASPVLYRDIEGFEEWFGTWALELMDAEAILKTLSIENVTDLIFEAFRTMVICTKHPAFVEEAEWRVFHTVGIDEATPLELIQATVSGIPQPIFQLHLRDVPEEGLVGLAIPQLIHKIIIGPTSHPGLISDALNIVLSKEQVPNARERIFTTNIPLR